MFENNDNRFLQIFLKSWINFSRQNVTIQPRSLTSYIVEPVIKRSYNSTFERKYPHLLKMCYRSNNMNGEWCTQMNPLWFCLHGERSWCYSCVVIVQYSKILDKFLKQFLLEPFSTISSKFLCTLADKFNHDKLHLFLPRCRCWCHVLQSHKYWKY